jgi:hypothetical protein
VWEVFSTHSGGCCHLWWIGSTDSGGTATEATALPQRRVLRHAQETRRCACVCWYEHKDPPPFTTLVERCITYPAWLFVV